MAICYLLMEQGGHQLIAAPIYPVSLFIAPLLKVAVKNFYFSGT